MKVGFTGTHLGMTLQQQESVRRYLIDFGTTELHHGDCIGADAQAHEIAFHLSLPVIVHPPLDQKKRAYVERGRILEIKPEYPYLERNKHIVEACELLIAAPKTMQEIVRSGTWSTIRYARRLGRELIIVGP